MVEARNFKFGKQRQEALRKNVKLGQRGSGRYVLLEFWNPSISRGKGEAKNFKFGTHTDHGDTIEKNQD